MQTSLRVFGLSFSCVLFLCCVDFPEVAAQQVKRPAPLPYHAVRTERPTATEEDGLPTITYPGSRRSSAWITTERGRVAIDEGIEFNDTRFYISMTYDLIAASETDEAVWSHSIGAFWNKLSIEKIQSTRDGVTNEIHVVAIRNDRSEEMKEYVKYYDLETGESIPAAWENRKPGGQPFKVEPTWKGNDFADDAKTFRVFDSEEEWSDFHSQYFNEADSGPPAEAFDSSSQILVVVAYGKVHNCRGISVARAFEDDSRILVRMQNHGYQSHGDVPPEHPYGVFVLPKRDGKKYIFETNRQSYIGGPAIWKTYREFEL